MGEEVHYPSRHLLPTDLSVTEVFEHADFLAHRRRQQEVQYSTGGSALNRSQPESWSERIPSRPYHNRRSNDDPRFYDRQPHFDLPDDTQAYREFLAAEIERIDNSRSTWGTGTEQRRRRRVVPDLEHSSYSSSQYIEEVPSTFYSRSRDVPVIVRQQEEHPAEYPPGPSPRRPGHDEPPSIGYKGHSSLGKKPQQQIQQETDVEITPGQYLPLRGSAETMKAISRGFYVTIPCLACSADLQCIADCQVVLCPDCRVVSANTEELDESAVPPPPTASSDYGMYKRGVGLGLKVLADD